MKKALILSPFFYPEPISTGKYNTYLASTLVENNIDVTVYCSHPLYPTWKIEPSNQQIPGCLVKRGGRYVHYGKHPLVRRFILEGWFACFCLVQLTRSRQYDIVIPIFPPSIFANLLHLFIPKQSKIIGIVHDLQGIYAANNNSLTHKALSKLIIFFESKAFQQCDHLVYLSESMRKSANSSYQIHHCKTSVHYPFITIDKFENRGALTHIIPDNQTSFVYSGALGDKQAPDRIIQLFLTVLENHAQLHCYIFSQGPIFDKLKISYKHPRLHFHSLVAEEHLPELLLRSNIQLLPQEPGTANGSLPSKLPNILAAGTKLLCITDADSELVDIINAYPLGDYATDWNIDKLNQQVTELLSLPDKVDQYTHDALLSRFTRQALVKHILSLT